MMTHIVTALLPGVETLINQKPSILWELIFRQDLKQKLAPQRPLMYPRHFLLARWKKLRALGTRLPTKVDIFKVHYSSKLWVKLNCDLKETLKVFILSKYGCNNGLILLEHSTFNSIAFIITMWSHKFNKYSYLHLQKDSLVSRACCISDITQL